MKQHFQYIDRLKGFAILTVVMGHYVIYVLNQKDIILELIGAFHMPLFMFLSGLVISEVPKIGKSFTKIVALLMPFFIIGFLFTLFIGESYLDLIHSALKYGYWYLWVLAVFYLLIQSFRIVRFRGGDIILAVLVYFLILWLNSNISSEWNEIFSVWVIRQYWPFFIMGYFFRRYNVLSWIGSHNWAFTLGLLGFVIGFVYYVGGNGHLFYLVAFSAIVAISYVFFHREGKDTWVERQLGLLGQHTLDIYIYHFFFIKMTNLESIGKWFEETDNVFPEILLGVLFSVIVAYVSMGVGMLLRKSVLVDEVIYGGFAKRLLRER